MPLADWLRGITRWNPRQRSTTSKVPARRRESVRQRSTTSKVPEWRHESLRQQFNVLKSRYMLARSRLNDIEAQQKKRFIDEIESILSAWDAGDHPPSHSGSPENASSSGMQARSLPAASAPEPLMPDHA